MATRMTTIAPATLQTAVTCKGVGLHSGEITTVTLMPALANSGIRFVRSDLPDRPEIPAQVNLVKQTMLSTELVTSNASVRTVEHLLAAL